MIKFSYFKNAFTDKPESTYTLEQFIEDIQSGTWMTAILKLRQASESSYKSLKGKLPAVTMSGEFRTRDKYKELDKRLKAHSAIICLDVDKKDNPKMRVKDLIDPDAVAEFVSAGGQGKKVVYKCKPVKTAQEHRRIFDACVERLAKKGIHIKVDPIVKNIAGLQYVSYDPAARYNPKTNVVIQPLPAVKRKAVVDGDNTALLVQLNEYIEALGARDITATYENWMLVLFGISYTLGEKGREAMHKISKNYKNYSAIECDEKYDSFLDTPPNQIEKPVTLNTVFHIINEYLPSKAKKQLGKKYSITHAIGEADDVEEQGDLNGLVRWKLFLFKKVFDKKHKSTISELRLFKLNLNAFEKLLKALGFFRYSYEGSQRFVHIQDNIVEQCDIPDILRIVTDFIEKDGDYHFIYKQTEYKFSWEDVAHLWREVRATSSMFTQVPSSLTHWKPNLLRDSSTQSFIPYANGVLQIDANEINLRPYSSFSVQIWKEQILPRPFEYTKKIGMFQEFFANVMGRQKDKSNKHYNRGLWYYGYMLQGSKRQSTARAWILYDIKAGNNGRTGKTILGSAVGKIRSVTVIDGKQVDLRNRFAFQTVQPWTKVIFIDDPSKYTSLNPLFNMITGQTSTDRKGKDPIVSDDIKLMLASNWILESGGNSEKGRQFVNQLDDYYVRYSIEHNNTITPIVDHHGKEFFTDWDKKDWSCFDSFSARAIQFHLKEQAPDNLIIGNSSQVRFVQLHEEELFHSLCSTLAEYARPSGDGYLVQQLLMTMVVRDANADLKNNKAGKIVREFLACVGGTAISMSTVRAGAQVVQAYYFEGNVDFGIHNELLKDSKLKTKPLVIGGKKGLSQPTI